MFIKSVTIDGFKSYAQRTEIKGFDPLFNAITGLNGSGKSNILDSICFLLGISNLSQVRATNLQDLVYKSGQAGINKATVSISFDNTNKQQSPIGMEAHNEITITRQIVIGGRNKYLINGVNAQNSRVSDLFRSVGLNVNNPHFLIMQGRVTKVMNMKPPEILSMIEEATGTSMYESKKESAQRMMEKKENKLTQINQILDEELTPTIQKLRNERSSYLEYQKVQREVERFTRLLIAYQFLVATRTANDASGQMEEIKSAKAILEQQAAELQTKLENIGKEIEELEGILDKEAGSRMKELETTLGEKEKLQAKAQSNLTKQKDIIKSENKKLKNIQTGKTECESSIASSIKSLDKLAKNCDVAEAESQKQADALKHAESHFEAVCAGLASADNGEEASWNAQLIQVKNEISQLQSDSKQNEIRLKHTKKELQSKVAELKKTEATYRKDEEVYKKAEKVLEKLKQELNKINYREGLKEELLKRKRDVSAQITNLRRASQNLYNQFPNLQFNYKDPEKNWDRSRVKGLVAELLQIKDPMYATALEVVAGGRLYNVVVDNNETGAKLLKNGQLQRRCTIIPLNKIAARSLNADKVRHAKALVGQDNAHLALSLVGGKDEITAALEYVFGSTVVCRNMNDANKVAFDSKIMARTVTLGGEVFDPSGTLTGGARPHVAPVLAELHKAKASIENLKEAEAEFETIEQRLGEVASVMNHYVDVKDQIDIKENEIKMLQQKLSGSSHGQLLKEIDNLTAAKGECEEVISTFSNKMSEMQARVKELERKLADAPAERERELKKAETDLNRVKNVAEKAAQTAVSKREEVNTLKLDIESLKEDLKQYEEQIADAEKSVALAQDDFSSLKTALQSATEVVQSAKDELKQHRQHVQTTSREIKSKTREAENIHLEKRDCVEKIQEKDNAIAKHIRESNDATERVSSLQAEYDWIEKEKSLFGCPGSPYDFQANPPKELARRLDNLKETQEKLSHSVNMRAMSLLGKAEERFNELIKKKKIVANDKAKIQKTIEELDQKKNEAVTKAYAQVNKNFGAIFSTLLPGATAKLAPPEGSSVLAGLEFQVGFGEVWKKNLNELSGGQRSLVALSLILALLLLKPAPIYILDEVDAALDLSHTQNIGGMLREHFKHSQFIVVSLKDGMFNNANVLFRTKFVDGVSTVNRYTQSSGANRNTASLTLTNVTPAENNDGKKSQKSKRNSTKLESVGLVRKEFVTTSLRT